MSDIFISYAREDLNEVRLLAGALEAQGWSVFWDRTIPAGKSWREVIGVALADARCIVVLWSQDSVNSHWVLEEADYGLKRRVLIPAFIESIEPPLGFGSIQAADLSTWAGDYEHAAIQQFLRDVAGILGPAPAIAAGRQRNNAEAEARRRGEEQQRQQATAEAKRETANRVVRNRDKVTTMVKNERAETKIKPISSSKRDLFILFVISGLYVIFSLILISSSNADDSMQANCS